MDPWNWTVDQVVSNICYSRELWSDYPHANLPDSTVLKSTLTEQEVTGVTLLTQVTNDVLKSDLGIKSLGQRSALLFAIRKLRGQSKAWKSHEAAGRASEQQISELVTASDANARNPQSSGLGVDLLTVLQPPLTPPQHEPVQLPPDTSKEVVAKVQVGNTKRRKLIPQNLGPATVSTQLPSRTGYLGRKRTLAQNLIFGRAENNETPHPELDHDLDDDEDLNIINDGGFQATGQTRFISRCISRSLRAEPQVLAPDQMSLTPLPEWLTSALTPSLLVEKDESGNVTATKQTAISLGLLGRHSRNDTDYPVPTDLAGAEGLLEKYPPTQDQGRNLQELTADDNGSEISDISEQTVDETSESGQHQSPYLDSEAVDVAIDEAIAAFETSWRERKLPALESKAWLVWRQARGRLGQTKLATIAFEMNNANKYLSKLRQQIHSCGDWKQKSQVVKQCEVMDITLAHLWELQWKRSVINHPTQPPRTALVRSARRKEKHVSNGEIDDEIEVESESEHLSDFIEDDEPSEQRMVYGGENAQPVQPEERTELLEHDNIGPGNEDRSPLDQAQYPPVKSEDVDMNQPSDDEGVLEVTQNVIPSDAEIIDLTGVSSSPPDGSALVGGHDRKLESRRSLSPSTALKDAAQATIKSWRIEDLEKSGDRKRLLIKLLMELKHRRFILLREEFLGMTSGRISVILQSALQTYAQSRYESLNPTHYDLVRLFISWVQIDGRDMRISHSKHINSLDHIMDECDSRVGRTFTKLLRRLLPDYLAAANERGFLDLEQSPRKRRTSKKKRTGQHLRESAARRGEAALLSSRRMTIEGHAGDSAEQRDGVVINPLKDERQDFIYIDETLSSVLKPHQIEGIQFLWREVVVAGHDGRSGCLLAHTMGLGKTIQTIAFLSTVVRAAASDERSVISQIPKKMRALDECLCPRIMVLCPPSLIQNWLEEFKKWLPSNDVLRSYTYAIESSTSPTAMESRCDTIDIWFTEGGILVLGYEMLRNLLNETSKEKGPKGAPAKTQDQLKLGPAILVADEAHKFKDPGTMVAQAINRVKARGRIALTGSPLANNLGEYFTLIDWATPGFLGAKDEFREYYQRPIEDGTYADSTRYEQRRSAMKLHALTKELAPKVNRMTVAAIRNDLPPKTEFVIRVDLSELQKDAYRLFVEAVTNGKDDNVSRTKIFDWVVLLKMLCFKPQDFLAKISSREATSEDGRGGKQSSEHRTKAVTKGTPEQDEDVNMADLEVPDTMLERQKQLFATVEAELGAEALRQSAKISIIEKIVLESVRANDRVLIFSHLTAVHDDLFQRLSGMNTGQAIRIQRISGSTPTHDRPRICKMFNEGQFHVMLISTKAGGLGLNLYGANRVILADFGWTPSWEEQAVGRAYRLGQNRHVFVYHLLCGGTFEEPLHQKTVFKKQLAYRAVDKENTKPVAVKMKDFIFPPKPVQQAPLDDVKGKDAVLDAILACEDLGSIRSVDTTDIMYQEDQELTAEELKQVEDEEQAKRVRLQQSTGRRLILNLQGLKPSSTPSRHLTHAHAAPSSSKVTSSRQLEGITLGRNRPPTVENMRNMTTRPTSESAYENQAAGMRSEEEVLSGRSEERLPWAPSDTRGHSQDAGEGDQTMGFDLIPANQSPRQRAAPEAAMVGNGVDEEMSVASNASSPPPIREGG